jgi:cytochrome c2
VCGKAIQRLKGNTKGAIMNKVILRLAVVAAVCGLSAAVRAEGDAAKGENVFKKCKICHQVGENAKNQVGPQLNGVVGRKAGTVEGFNYSPAMKEAGEKGLVWNDESLSKYVENPKDFVPKNKMAFVGLKQESERADVIAYLKTVK